MTSLIQAQIPPASSMLQPVHDAIRKFMTFGQQHVSASPNMGTKELWQFRMKLIDEEYQEMQDAWIEGDLVAFADAYADFIYVLIGTGVAFGLPPQLFDEVHNNNMTKFTPEGLPYRKSPEGKVLKPENWQPPNIDRVLKEHVQVEISPRTP
jgi:predicted HAD superfamily Cof-like phosphohydrolase